MQTLHSPALPGTRMLPTVKPSREFAVNTSGDLLARIRTISDMAAFNRWCGIEVVAAEHGGVTIAMPWRDEVGQYSGFLHAGLIGALIDTACGFAAATLGDRVIASHYSVNCLRPATGSRFIARARVVKPGKSQIFTACELFAENDAGERLVATGETLLLVVNQDSQTQQP